MLRELGINSKSDELMGIIFTTFIKGLLDFLQNTWLSDILTLATLFGFLIAFRKYLLKTYYRRTTYTNRKTMEKFLAAELDRSIERRESKTKEAAKKPEKTDRKCSECKGVIGYDNRHVVTVKDIAGDFFQVYHRDCASKTKHLVPVWKNEKDLRIARFSNLWKSKNKPSGLSIDTPKLLSIEERRPDGIRWQLVVPTDIRELDAQKQKEVKKISFEDAQMRQAYKKGPWGEQHYDEVKRKMNLSKMNFFQTTYISLAEKLVTPDYIQYRVGKRGWIAIREGPK
jgi:hypothetical protein